MVKHLPHLWDMCSTEIVVRSTKHILKVLSFVPSNFFLYILIHKLHGCIEVLKDGVVKTKIFNFE